MTTKEMEWTKVTGLGHNDYVEMLEKELERLCKSSEPINDARNDDESFLEKKDTSKQKEPYVLTCIKCGVVKELHDFATDSTCNKCAGLEESQPTCTEERPCVNCFAGVKPCLGPAPKTLAPLPAGEHESQGENMREPLKLLPCPVDKIESGLSDEEFYDQVTTACQDCPNQKPSETETELRDMCYELAARLYRHVDMRCTCKDPDCLNDRQTLMDYTRMKEELKG